MSCVALVGNPNCGKTTVFNLLTKSRCKVGNRAGVTVDIKEGQWQEHTLIDLPGIYSLENPTAEEQNAAHLLLSGNIDIILNIVDATNPKRSLMLSQQLAELGIPMVIMLNMADKLEESGFCISTDTLAALSGTAVILTSAAKGKGLFDIPLEKAKIPKKFRADEVFKKAFAKIGVNKPLTRSIKADRILLGSAFSGLIFAFIMSLIFYLTFGSLGKSICTLSSRLFLKLCENTELLLRKHELNPFLISLLCDGILTSVGGIVPFFGQITILFLCIALMEDTGYMSRVIVLVGNLCDRLNIDARSAVSLITGLGCGVPAAMAAKNISDKGMRKKTLTLLPFISCSAKLPIYIIFTSIFFDKFKFTVIAALYALGIFSACLAAKAKKELVTPFVVELPPYRMPTAKNTLNQLKEKLADFLKRAGSVIILAGIAVWLMNNFNLSFKKVTSMDESILGQIGAVLAPLLKPCGFGNKSAAVALLSGIMAKEAIISTLSVTGGIESVFTPRSAASFLVFVLFYPPCIAALSAIGKELSKKELLMLILRQLLLAYAAAVVTCFLVGFVPKR